MLQLLARGGKVVAVTAPEWGPAKTALAASLARMAARANLRVAVIDCGLTNPVTARAFGIGAVRFGLIEALTGAVPLSRAFCRDPRSPVQILSVAQRPGDAAAVLASAKMAGQIAHLRSNCDLIIVDAPPLPCPCGSCVRRRRFATRCSRSCATAMPHRR